MSAPPTRRTRGAALLALAICAACRPSPPERLVVGFVAVPATALVLCAQDRGTFAAEGIAVELREFAAGRDALRALTAGEVDVATAFVTPVVLAAAAGAPVRLLTRLHRASGATAIVARADRGVERIEDLAGKRVGVPRSTNADYFLDLLLAFAGIPDAAVTRVDLAPHALVPALQRGEVDAIAAWAPVAQRAARALGSGARLLTSELYHEATALVTREDVLASRAPALRRMLAALWRAEGLLAADPTLALPALARALPREDPGDLREAYARVTPLVGVDNLLLTVLRAEAAWASRASDAPPALDVARILAPGLLSEVAPDAVTLEATR